MMRDKHAKCCINEVETLCMVMDTKDCWCFARTNRGGVSCRVPCRVVPTVQLHYLTSAFQSVF